MPPIPITRAEYEAKYGIKPVISTSTLDTTPAPIRITRAEYNAIYRPEVKKQETLGTKLADRGGDIYKAITEERGVRTPMRAFGAVAGGLGDIASAAIAPVFEATTEAISDIPVVQKLADTKAIRSGLDVVEKGGGALGEKWKQFETAQPEIAQDIKDITNIAMTVPFGKPAKVALDVATPPIKQALDERTLIKREKTLFDIESGYAKGRKANEYSKDAGSASRNRIAQTDVLVGAVDDNGLIRTKGQGGAVEKYKAQTIDGVESVVRDNLIRENKTINLKEVENYLKLKIAESGLEGGDLVNALGGVKKELQGLQLRADELGNVPLAKVHDAKISTTNNIDFNTPAETKTYRKSLAEGYKELVERKSETEVKKVNSELAKYYEDIERLKRLDGMRVKGGKLGKYFAQTAGTMIGMGAGSVGGGVGAALGGMIGGEVAGAIKGKALAGTMGKAGKEVPVNPILEKAKADSKLPAERPLTQPDLKLGAPEGLPKTKEVLKLEGQIAKNVDAQKKAIKAGDFTLVATLKEIYDVLVQALKDIVKELKTNNKGMVNFGAELPKKKKLSDDEIEDTLDELANYDSSAVTIAKRDATISTGFNKTLDLGSDDNFRLEQLKNKSIEKSLTPAEIVEANTLLKKTGLIEDTKSKPTGTKSTYTQDPKTGKLTGSKPAIKGVADPLLKTKREVSMKDVAGNKFTVPANTVIKPLIADGKTYVKVGSKQYAIPKNQYDNLKGQSDASIATPFAPELKGTVETVKGTGGKQIVNAKTRALDKLRTQGYSFEEDMSGEAMIMYRGDIVEYNSLSPSNRKLVDDAIGEAETFREMEMPTKYSQYTLPGGENYREILIRDPQSNYQSSHWPEKGVISHLRFKEYNVDGKKYAFMEELQSDWAREGRDKGFTGITTLPEGWKVSGSGDNFEVRDPQNRVQATGSTEQVATKNALLNINNGSVPNNPLLKDWQIPTTKRALMEAVDSGADRFAWINGEQTSARYNLATHVDEVGWKTSPSQREDFKGRKNIALKPKQSGLIDMTIDKNGTIVEVNYGNREWNGKKLDEVLGKGLADKIMEKETGTLSGEGLSFGGEWAKNLYDRQVRDIVKKLTGAEVKTVDLGLGVGKKNSAFYPVGKRTKLTKDDLFVGDNIETGEGQEYVITEVLGNGKFKAIDTEDFEGTPKEFDLSADSQTQQYIELTPEVKAKIQSKAPKFSMKKPSAGEALPLIFLLLGGGVVATQS